MRMRKLKWAHEYLNTERVVTQEPMDQAGHWKQSLNCEVLHVEIGSGKGDYWVNMAKMYPEEGFIGVEKNESAAALSVRKYSEHPQSNMKFIYRDAQDIDTWFEAGEVDVLHLNFSDPWPKRRTSKRRLSHPNFLKRYEKILSDEGQIIMKTDNVSLFEFSLVEFSHLNWLLSEVWVDFRSQTHDEDAISEYESRFMELGQPIYRAIFKKRK